jgi:mannose-6-phosphate isomerase-like protein (cupin superfamily)
MVREAKLEDSEFGKSGPGGGWFVVNGREARWRRREQRGVSLNLTGQTDEECETHFDQLGVNLNVLEPGEIIGFYHWEADQEGFLVLYGEALLMIEGEERPLRQ